MTEKQLRQKYVDTAASHLGMKGMTDNLQALIDLYNDKRTEENARWGTRTTKMIMSEKKGWGWCALFVSACGQECCLDTIIPCEIGVWEYYKIASNFGIWWSPSKYTPQMGDVVIYDWGPNSTWDHIEIVESCDGTTLHTIGGNNGDTPGVCSRRDIALSDSQILGYIAPNYASIATEETEEAEEQPTYSASQLDQLFATLNAGDTIRIVAKEGKDISLNVYTNKTVNVTLQ